ncbi:hypothetical protein ACJRO7_016864 [Eucalyptus globulus]|uniref:Uncharacterized protein n=1 Tax=Eucalyptus globulus TaxID=34317 RepID=A0ABD3KSN2_EUCGL
MDGTCPCSHSSFSFCHRVFPFLCFLSIERAKIARRLHRIPGQAPSEIQRWTLRRQRGAAEESTVVGMLMQEPAAAAAERKSARSFYSQRWMLDHLLWRSSPMITLVHVQQPFQHDAFPAGPAFYATPSVESTRKAQKENSALVLSRALHTCKESMVMAETLILSRDPKRTIC